MHLRATYAISATIIAVMAVALCVVVIVAPGPLWLEIAFLGVGLLALAAAGGLVGMAVRAGAPESAD
ncbi:MAG TPA: hypothetical protein VK015_05290 [Microbacterium sp.]|nr:hypothetical protein [Microbacterium sp.]